MNRVILIGRINGEPEVRQSTKTNKLFTSLCLITTKPAFVSPTGESYPAREQMHRIACFGRTVELLQQHAPLAGKVVCVDGELNYSTLQDQYGNIQSRTEIFASNVEII